MKAQLCPVQMQSWGPSGRGMHPFLCDGQEILGPFVLLTLWQGRLVLGEKACDYFKHRHFPFSFVTVNLGN